MRRALTNAKTSGPSKLLRKVLSKSSLSSNSSGEKNKIEQSNEMSLNLELEVSNLKEQISKLQNVVNNMHHDTEKKEEAIANLAREKEKLSCELYKEKRSNTNLKQQLEEEREYYYREKEIYCKEMNEIKKLKKKVQEEQSDAEVFKLKKEVNKLKEVVNQTLEVNYNLSVKFLRMKNTKYCLKNRLRKLQDSHSKMITECEKKILLLKNELHEVLSKHFGSHIHPSNKRYLQLVKQNGNLVHENMRLQIEVDKLNLEIERLKMMELRTQTNNKLTYIKSKNSQQWTNKQSSEGKSTENPNKNNTKKKISKHEVIQGSKINKESMHEHKVKNVEAEKIMKIFERNEETDVPNVLIKEEKYLNLSEKLKKEKKKVVTYSDLKENAVLNQTQSLNSFQEGKIACINVTECTSTCQSLHINECDSKYDRMQVSDVNSKSNVSEYSQYTEAIRTQSAPEIVQSSSFVNQT